MLARTGTMPTDQDDWAFEVKWDGVRAIVRSSPDELELRSRLDNDISAGYPELEGLQEALGTHRAVLDGEILAFDDDGRPSFQALQERMHVRGSDLPRLVAQRPVTLMLFDLLWLDGESLIEKTYDERRAALEALKLEGPHWQTPAAHPGRGRELLAATAEQRLEGVIAKRRDSRYSTGRRNDAWIKIKHQLRQEFVVGGWWPGKGARKGTIGSLQIGVYDDEDRLRHAGGVGTGFDRETLDRLHAELTACERGASPFDGRQPPRGTHFVDPTMVVEVRFAGWTDEGSVRQAAFLGVRDDRDPTTVVREDAPAVDPNEAVETPDGPAPSEEIGPLDTEQQPRAGDEDDRPPKGARRGTKRSARSAKSPSSDADDLASRIPDRGDHVIDVDDHEVKLSSLDKPYYPGGWTKGDVLRYYARIAPVILPHLRDRPVTLKRYPSGVEGQSFFNKHAPDHRPEWVSTARVRHGEGKDVVEYVLIQNRATLLWAVNLSAIELHPSLSQAHDDASGTKWRPPTPTALVFDLDPGPGTTIVECCAVAIEIRAMLGDLGLDLHAKTSGSKGLQVYAPLADDVSYDRSKPFAHAVASLLEDRHPERIVSRMKKSLRDGKVLIDWSQNSAHKTTVGVYSLRARERPTVSTPVTWDEVERCAASEDPDELVFTADDVLARVARDGDCFAAVLDDGADLPELSVD
ncbi:MAG: DNA ligase D [Patulibacter sp.]